MAPGKTAMLLGVLCAVVILPVVATDLCEAAPSIPGEGQMGISYTIAHLHPAAYLVFFLIFVLSALNLVYQFWLAGDGWASSWKRKMRSRSSSNNSGGSFGSGSDHGKEGARKGTDTAGEGIYQPFNNGNDERVSNVRRISADTGVVSGQPTPLQGTDHRLPRFSGKQANQTGAPRLIDVGDLEKDSSGTELAVIDDFLSSTESMDTDSEELVVSGTVQRPNGKRIPEAIVYLTDENGKRVGQSCLSRPVTGEYKVTAPAPGRYVLKGHKRGLVLESSEPPVLPAESGKVDEYILRMIPEGCLILGSVICDGDQESLSDLEVKCICEADGVTRSGRTDYSGQFSIDGVAHDSTCHLEVRDSSDELLGASAEFQTFLEKEIYKEIKLTKDKELDEAVPTQEVTTITGWDEHDERASGPTDQPPFGR